MLRIALATLAAVAMMAAAFPSGGQPVVGASAIQSSVSFYLNCPSSLAFALPGGGGSCGSGNYSSVYSGVSQTVGATQNSVFYLASAQGGVKVTFKVTDEVSHQPLISGVGYGSISGGTCSTPSVVVPASFTTSSNVINSGDNLQVFLNITFTGTGTPQFCSGGASASLIGLGTAPITGSSPAYLTTTFSAGTPMQTILSGFPGVSETYTSASSVSMTAVVLGYLKSGNGTLVDVLTTSVTVPPGQSVTAFLPLGNYHSGAYSITVVAITSSLVPLSTAASGTVSV